MNTAFEMDRPYKFKRNPDWSVDIGIAAGCILGYILAWIGLICYLYVQHWMAGVIGALAGGMAGWAWYFLRLKKRNNA
jgi:hypothetical protein